MSNVRMSPRAVKRYRAMVRRYEEKLAGFNFFGRGLHNSNHVDEESRYSFYLAFGVTPQLQRALEEQLDQEDLTPTLENYALYQSAWDAA